MKVGDVCNRVVIFVTQDEPGDRMEAIDRAGDERVEGIVIAGSGVDDQVTLHWASLRVSSAIWGAHSL